MDAMVLNKAPKITIDHEKCTVPFLCKKCIRACSQVVFTVGAVKMERWHETDPRVDGTYRLGTGPRFKCTGCNDCIEACPVDAIAIEWTE